MSHVQHGAFSREPYTHGHDSIATGRCGRYNCGFPEENGTSKWADVFLISYWFRREGLVRNSRAIEMT
ncbi:Uncharacterized protein APZ42_023566 [Daphnia magna]|uniref:Uncharacterized protein n=1 Tax=Daphnia magna TaxID=35525 RepID=A0A0P5B5C3_9CRUS|nr:Uncharacterized protein APZ42_023566 [Daphnia magna]